MYVKALALASGPMTLVLAWKIQALALALWVEAWVLAL